MGDSPQKDLRSFLAQVAETDPGSIRHVHRRVSRDCELAAVVKRAEANGNPIIFFDDVEDSALPVVCGVHATRERIALALQGEVESLVNDYAQRTEETVEPVIVPGGPVKDVVMLGPDVDLGRLPIVKHAAGDAGLYIGSGVGIARDPSSGAVNTGIYRLMVTGRNTLTCHVNRLHHLAEIIRRAAEEGQRAELVVMVGHHPAYQIGSQSKIPITRDALAHTGALLGEPVQLTRAETLELNVPAYAEIVLECVVREDERAPDGPYGEFPYYYGSDPSSYVLDVTAITHRHDAIFLDLHNVHTEHRMLWIFPGREANLLGKVRDILPRTKAVHIPDSGAGLHAYVSIDKLREGDGKNAILAALGADHILKHVVVVDDDIDVHDEQEVLWAIATRFQGDRDLIIVPGSHCTVLDPSSYSLTDRHKSTGMTTKMGLDATMTVEVPFAQRADTLDDRFASLDLAEYFSQDA